MFLDGFDWQLSFFTHIAIHFRAPCTNVLQRSEFWGDRCVFLSKSPKKRWRRENLKNGAGDIFVWYLHSFGTSRIRSWSIVFLIFFEDFPKFGFCSERVSHTFSFHVRAPNSTVLHTHTPSISVLHTHTLSSSVLQTHTPTNPVICILPQVCPTYNGSKTYCCWKKSCTTSNTNTYSYWD